MKYNIIFFLFSFLVIDLNAQTYIQGKEVIPSSNIVNSSLIPLSKRINMDEAYNIYKTRGTAEVYNKSSQLVGEFWLIDNILINIVSRNLSSTRKENFQKLRYTLGPKGASTGKLKHEYFDTIKTVNNYEVFIHYYYNSKNKSFIIQDKQGRYKLMGSIISTETDTKKAEAFMDTLLNSITFK